MGVNFPPLSRQTKGRTTPAAKGKLHYVLTGETRRRKSRPISATSGAQFGEKPATNKDFRERKRHQHELWKKSKTANEENWSIVVCKLPILIFFHCRNFENDTLQLPLKSQVFLFIFWPNFISFGFDFFCKINLSGKQKLRIASCQRVDPTNDSFMHLPTLIIFFANLQCW